jgi:hypothetical protein
MRFRRSPSRAARAALIPLVPLHVLAGAPVSEAQSGRWSGAIGLVATADPDEPYSGGVGPEISLWRVLGERVDVGVRVSQLTFDSDGMTFPQAPFLLPGEGKMTPVELALRFYPAGSARSVFPLLGLSVVAPLSDSFSAERVALPGQVGVFLDGDWDVDSVGFGAEAGLRWDVSERWFLELDARYVLLGAESSGTIEVTPVISAPRVVETSLDGVRIGAQIGIYF